MVAQREISLIVAAYQKGMERIGIRLKTMEPGLVPVT
jgi:hypothetical protein